MPVAASYDHGRAKHDRAMNSSVGVATIIGPHSSKILGYDSWAKSRVCETVAHNGTVLSSMTVSGTGPPRLWSQML